jgi:hypothetical protein
MCFLLEEDDANSSQQARRFLQGPRIETCTPAMTLLFLLLTNKQLIYPHKINQILNNSVSFLFYFYTTARTNDSAHHVSQDLSLSCLLFSF